MSPIELSEHEFESTRLGNSRSVWVQPSRRAAPASVCIVLDAEYYVDRLGGPAIFEELQSGGSIPPVLVVYVSHLDSATRWTESFCNTSFDQFIVDELLPWVTKEYDLPATIDSVITGLSLTGLGAAHAALNARNRISRALCQSASFWWQQGWLVENLTTLPPSDVAFRISVGTEETIQNVDHGQGLIQSESQINALRNDTPPAYGKDRSKGSGKDKSPGKDKGKNKK